MTVAGIALPEPAAKALGLSVIALTGPSGALAAVADVAIAVPCTDTQHMQEAHIAIDQDKIEDMTCIKQAIRERLASSFNITHSTLEFEFEDCCTHSIGRMGSEPQEF